MGYDLLVGNSSKFQHNPAMAGAIDLDEWAVLRSLSQIHRCWLFDRLCNYFEDQIFTLPELREAVDILDHTIMVERGEAERRILYKISAIFSMALRKDLPVQGIAD